MGLPKIFKKILGIDDSENQDGPRYLPQPIDGDVNAPRVDLRNAALDSPQQGPRYLPPPPAPPDLTGTDTRGPVYDPPVPAPTTAQPQTAQPQDMAAKYMASAVPMEDTTRPRAVNPVPAQQGAQVTYVTKRGQQVPTGATGGTKDEQDQALLEAYQQYAGNVQNHNSRGKSALIDFGRAYLHGGGLVGAVTGAVQGLVDPASDERYANEQHIATTGRAVAQAAAQRKAASDLANEDMKRQQEAADIQLKQHPIYEPKPTQAEDGTYANITPGNDTAQPIYAPAKPGEARVPFKGKTPAEKAGKTVIHWNKDGKAEMWKVEDGVPTEKVDSWPGDPSLDKVRDKYGNLVPQSTDSMRRATEASQEWTRTHTTGREAIQDANRAEDKATAATERQQTKIKDASSHKAAADAAEERWKFADQKYRTLKAQADTAQTPEEKAAAQKNADDWDLERQRAKTAHQQEMTYLKSAHPDLFKVNDNFTELGSSAQWQPFSVKKARAAGAKQADIDEAVRTAKARGQEVID